MRSGFSVTLLLLTGQSVFAQQAVQQPVVGTTSINTVVSVPDGGSMLLGGVSSAQSARAQYGPLRTGTALGVSRQTSSMRAYVRIIDLQEMDEELLRSSRAVSDRMDSRIDRLNSRRVVERSPEPEQADIVSPAAKVARSEELALSAEKAGKMGVAKLHWQMAAKYGSKAAEKRLAELSKPTISGSTQSVSR